MSTPQSVLSETRFHDTRPKLTTAAAALKAIIASMSLISKYHRNLLPNIHDKAVTMNTTMVMILGLVQGISGWSILLIRTLRLGFNTKYIAPSNKGVNTKVKGRPNFIQSIKEISKALAAMALVGAYNGSQAAQTCRVSNTQ